jgi:hypothetical protein
VSPIIPDFTKSVVVRHAAAEVIGQQPITVRLLADSLLEVQELYDTYFRTSPTWDAGRPGPTSAI